MKKLTVKDFIASNAPCFSCGSDIDVRLIISAISGEVVSRKPNVLPTYISIDLKTTWDSTLKLTIDHKTNKFSTNDFSRLKVYLEKESRSVHLTIGCGNCGSFSESSILEFDWDKCFVKPIFIETELIAISDDKNAYVIASDYIDNVSQISVVSAKGSDAVKLDTPLISRYKFRDKAHLINKIKTYLTFS